MSNRHFCLLQMQLLPNYTRMHVIPCMIKIPIAIAFVELKRVCDYKKCTVMETITLLSIGVNVLLLI